MNEGKFKIPGKGPGKKLARIFQYIEDALNAVYPQEGIGIEISRETNGSFVSTKTSPAVGAGAGGDTHGGGKGTPINVYGAYNGAPAVFHLLQSSAPSAP